MNDDELKKLWQQQPLRDPALSAAQLIPAMQQQTTQLRRIVGARDIRELVACAVVIIIFACFFFFLHAREPIVRLGDLIVIGSTIFIGGKLVHTRRATPPAPPGATTVESLRAELNSVRAQSRLLGSVLWWYILPGFIGLLVMTWGSLPIHDPVGLRVMLPTNLVVTLFFIAVDWSIYRLNQRAVTKQLLPVKAQLESLIHSAETGEPLDQTHVANLRPIFLSLAAAEKVKPVEFKVSFWQIAIFGLPGVLGIWFFWMFDQTKSDAGWKTQEPARPAVVQSFHFEATNRYSVVAREVVDLFNAGDYAAVHKLYNPGMSKVFPPKETSDFYTRLATGFGKIENIEGPIGNGFRGWTAFRLYCLHGEMIMSLALDTGDKISGIHFRPVLQPLPRHSASIGWRLLRVFSWKHLVWLVPFFLAGLLYSWLMQKITRRAVGISTLGIHLCKGQTLILWDEIKEVRPFRFLHVRNLWLIKESGETTRMHWTPLERHSDLKSAVENFAPANHPIRKHLSLLRPEPPKKHI